MEHPLYAGGGDRLSSAQKNPCCSLENERTMIGCGGSSRLVDKGTMGDGTKETSFPEFFYGNIEIMNTSCPGMKFVGGKHFWFRLRFGQFP